MRWIIVRSCLISRAMCLIFTAIFLICEFLPRCLLFRITTCGVAVLGLVLALVSGQTISAAVLHIRLLHMRVVSRDRQFWKLSTRARTHTHIYTRTDKQTCGSAQCCPLTRWHPRHGVAPLGTQRKALPYQNKESILFLYRFVISLLLLRKV